MYPGSDDHSAPGAKSVITQGTTATTGSGSNVTESALTPLPTWPVPPCEIAPFTVIWLPLMLMLPLVRTSPLMSIFEPDSCNPLPHRIGDEGHCGLAISSLMITSGPRPAPTPVEPPNAGVSVANAAPASVPATTTDPYTLRPTIS
ncbi:MAG: hypothetical protein ACRDZZ_11210 [Ilumatobacteraceae bacterium]